MGSQRRRPRISMVTKVSVFFSDRVRGQCLQRCLSFADWRDSRNGKPAFDANQTRRCKLGSPYGSNWDQE